MGIFAGCGEGADVSFGGEQRNQKSGRRSQILGSFNREISCGTVGKGRVHLRRVLETM